MSLQFNEHLELYLTNNLHVQRQNIHELYGQLLERITLEVMLMGMGLAILLIA